MSDNSGKWEEKKNDKKPIIWVASIRSQFPQRT
jgi:hypothetical protein